MVLYSLFFYVSNGLGTESIQLVYKYKEKRYKTWEKSLQL